MKFSIAAISTVLLSSIALSRADSYSDAISRWCGGLDVSFPSASTVVTAGSQTKVTVGRQPNEHEKHITGLDLYSVDSNGNAKYVANVWKGTYDLKTQASITDTIPENTPAGLYYYRVWVTNLVNGQHGPDCLETSHTFKVTSGTHVNAATGAREFIEHLDDANIYNSDHFEGCFGLSVDYPQEGATFKNGEHVQITANRDSASQTGALTKVELYKGDQLVGTEWEGSEAFQNSFTLKDHLSVDNVDTGASYHYKLYTASKKNQGKTCTFNSKNFKISY